jgi:hypothetical protein
MNIVIFDIDGCVSNDEHRRKYIDKDNDDLIAMYKNYHDRCEQDTVLPIADSFIRACRAAGQKIAFFTGRPIAYKVQTIRWIMKNLEIPETEGFILCMREEGDFRPSEHVKYDMVQMIMNQFRDDTIICAYDDQEKIVDMYEKSFNIPTTVLGLHGMKDFYYGDRVRSEPLHEVVAATTSDRSDSMMLHEAPPPYADAETPDDFLPRTTVDVLKAAAGTYETSNAVYKNNHTQVGEILRIMFPDGMSLHHAADHEVYSLLVQIVGKLTRFGNAGMRHQDSIRDLIVYAAMLETIMSKHDIKFP